MNINLSIIVVTYNCQSFIKDFFEGLLNSLGDMQEYEILVLDNDSQDFTVQIIKQFDNDKIKLISADINYGFSKGNNILIAKSIYSNILLLNPDVFGFSKDFWLKTFSLWDHLNPMFIKLLNQDGSFQDCVGDICGPRRLINRYLKPIDYASLSSPVEVGMGIMAFMLGTKECFSKIGLLSEEYHMYSEDMDWCYRANKGGYNVIFEPRVSLIHIGGASAKTVKTLNKTLLTKYSSQKKFINMHFKGINRIISLAMTNLMIFKIRLKK